MPTTITPEPADSPIARELIAELDAILGAVYPSESRHGYSVEKLLRQGVEFFLVRRDGAPVGCGGVQFFPASASEPAFAELKRMYIRTARRGSGLGRKLLEHLAAHVASRGVALLRLETGVHQHAAIGLYESFGFRRIPPFGNYRDDPVSVCYEMPIGG